MDKMKKLVIFDLDGTLLNTIADLAQSTNHALAELGYPVHDEDSYRQRVGNGINKLFERALPEGEKTEENVQRMRQAFIPYYNIHNADRSLPYPGIPTLLQHLQQKGIRLAVASNKYQAAPSKLITHYFPDINFAAVQSRTFNFTKCLFPGTEKQCEQLEKGFITDSEHNVTSDNYIRLQLFQWDTGKKFYIYSHGELLTETVSEEVEKMADKPLTINGKPIRKGEKYTIVEEVERPRVFSKITLTLFEDANGNIAENGGDAVALAKRNFEQGLANGIYELCE